MTGSLRCLTFNGNHICFGLNGKSVRMGSKFNIVPHHEGLTEDHFNLTASSRIRNHLAEDVLDKNMLLLICRYYPQYQYPMAQLLSQQETSPRTFTGRTKDNCTLMILI